MSRPSHPPWPPTARVSVRGIEQADNSGDKDTADIFTEISRGVDKYLWLVEAHLGSSAARETSGMPVMASQEQPTTTGKEGL